MKVPGQLQERAIAAARRLVAGRSAPSAPDVTVSDFEAFQHDGVSGNELLRASVSWSGATGDGALGLIAKRWEPTGWVSQILGAGTPVELILFENGLTSAVNALAGISSPVLEGVRCADQAWVIMEDVSDELARWRALTEASPDLSAERLLMDRLSRMHVARERPEMKRRLSSTAVSLVSRERRLRWLEDLYREWLGNAAVDPNERPELRKAKSSLERMGARGVLNAFLEWLPGNDRAAWQKHMLDRRGLIAAAADLPEALLHGDVTPRNVGIRQGAGEDIVLLIDWELSGRGTPAFDVVHFMGNPPLRAATNSVELLEHYYECYIAHGGNALDSATWRRSLHVALVHYGVGLFPLYAGMGIAQNDAAATAIAARVVERVGEAMTALRL